MRSVNQLQRDIDIAVVIVANFGNDKRWMFFPDGVLSKLQCASAKPRHSNDASVAV